MHEHCGHLKYIREGVLCKFAAKCMRNFRWTTGLCVLCIKERDAKTFAGVSRGNTIRGNTTRNSERKMALWEGLWEGHWKTSENLWKPLKTSEKLWNHPSQRSSQRPSQRQISLSEPLSPVAPNRVAPWNSYDTCPELVTNSTQVSDSLMQCPAPFSNCQSANFW